MTCPDCEYHKNRAARWRAEAYKQAGHDVIELPWVGLTEDEIKEIFYANDKNAQFWWEYTNPDCVAIGRAIEAKLKEKNSG